MTDAQETPDGGSPPPNSADPDGAGDMVKRSELTKAISRRSTAIAERDTAQAKVAELTTQLSTLQEAQSSHEQSMAGVTKDLADARSRNRQREFADAVLSDVPTKQQTQEADLMLAGLMAREGIDPHVDNWEEVASTATASLKARAPHLFEASTQAPVSAGGGAQSPPNKSDFAQYKTVASIPPELMGKIPKKEWDRILQAEQGGPIPGFRK